MKRRGTIVICAAVLLAALAVVGIAYADTPQPQVGICHATEGQHPFNAQDVNANSTAGGHGSHGDDIIPGYSYLVTDVHTEHRHWTDPVMGCPAGYSEHHGECRKWVDDTYLPAHTEHRDSYHWTTWENGHCHAWWVTCRGERTRTGEVDVAGHYIYADMVIVTPGTWGPWTDGHCTGQGTCEEQTVPAVYDDFAPMNLTTLYGWGATGAEVLANGCVIPPPPYEPCDTTMADPHSRVYGVPVDVGDPVWGPWADNGDGTFTRTGTQATTTPWTEDVVDGQDGQTVCDQIRGDDPGERTVEETREGNVWVGFNVDCTQAYAVRYTYDPSEGLVYAENESYAWVLPYELESVTLFGMLINELQVCHQDFPGCMDPEALNYDPLAEVPGGECNYTMCQWNPDIRATDADCHAPYCTWTVTMYWEYEQGWVWTRLFDQDSGNPPANYPPPSFANAACTLGVANPIVMYADVGSRAVVVFWENNCTGGGWTEGTVEDPGYLHLGHGCGLGCTIE